MVYDITRRDTFDNIRNWFNEATENGNPKMQFLLIGNKTDRQYEYIALLFRDDKLSNLKLSNLLMKQDVYSLRHQQWRDTMLKMHSCNWPIQSILNLLMILNLSRK
jgi:GTPase SAR1 family protein